MLVAVGNNPEHIYDDGVGHLDKRPGLDGCLKALRCDLTKRGVGIKVLAGEGASLDTTTTTANGRLILAIIGCLEAARAGTRPAGVDHKANICAENRRGATFS